MNKKCLKCGHIRKPSDLTPEYECPQCGAIYSKVDAAIKNRKELDNNTNYPEFPQYERYAACTKAKDWKGICDINKINYDTFGTKKELNVLPDYLEENEVVFAISSGVMGQTRTSNASDIGVNTWLVVLTNERFLFLDHAMMTKSVDTQSILHSHVQAVSASQGLILGKIQVDLGSRLVVIDNCQKASVKIIAVLANRWLRILQKQNIQETKVGGAAEMQEFANLLKIQIKNQERIISLLEAMKTDSAAFYGRVTKKS